MFGVPLWCALSALAVLACAFGDARQMRAAIALFANWLILTDYAELTGNQYDVLVNMAVDWLTVVLGVCSIDWIVLVEERRISVFAGSHGQALLAFSFGLGLIFHADFLVKQALGADPTSYAMRYLYWWRFHYLAWSQAALWLDGWAMDGVALFFAAMAIVGAYHLFLIAFLWAVKRLCEVSGDA